MAMGRPKAELILNAEERAPLRSMALSRSLPAALVLRAKLVPACAAGEPDNAIAARFETSNATAGKRRRRFIERRLAGLNEQLRPGKPRSIDDGRVAAMINTTLHAKPANGATHRSVRTLAAEPGISSTSVHPYFKLFAMRPHCSEHFKLSTDPFHIEKLRDVVELYLNLPDQALVLCVDERRQCQALRRTRPMLPLGLGYVEGVTHDYRRHGTTTLIVAFDVPNGAALADCKPRHRHEEFLGFLRDRPRGCSPIRTSTASSTTTAPAHMRRSRCGWPHDRAGTCTSFRPAARGRSSSIASSG
jgi:putative transposase